VSAGAARVRRSGAGFAAAGGAAEATSDVGANVGSSGGAPATGEPR